MADSVEKETAFGGTSGEKLPDPQVYPGPGYDEQQGGYHVEEEVEQEEKIDRDPEGINAHLRMEFTSVIAEPESLESIKCNWLMTRSVYSALKYGCYQALAILTGWALAICWGCCFACIGYCHVWYIIPGYRVTEMLCGTCYKFVRLFTKCCCDPLYESCALCLSYIRVRHTHVKAEPDQQDISHV